KIVPPQSAHERRVTAVIDVEGAASTIPSFRFFRNKKAGVKEQNRNIREKGRNPNKKLQRTGLWFYSLQPSVFRIYLDYPPMVAGRLWAGISLRF
ncbi:MAG TPA: hypothetical protein PLC40_10095, partial [Candidatus Hydrogenedentes bacterium]|nr:hypothetical protein [Candidatus Hydrogenedentota bacterium]